jgi:subtilisin family serine protease
VTSDLYPAWSEPFRSERRDGLARRGPFADDAPSVDWLTASGQGVTVAIIDSGVDGEHPAVGGRLVRSLRVELSEGDGEVVEDEDGGDVVGHGTACAGIIHGLAPDAELISIRVLGADNKGKGLAFAHAIDWVVEHRIPVANMSLSSRAEQLFATFHDLADQAYFADCLLVCSASNMQGHESYPSVFSSVVSVAAHDIPDPLTFFYNPRPPVEFGAWGVDVPVAWLGGSRIIATGNSFAAPHIAGLLARLRSVYPDVTPFEAKTLLARAANRGR